MDEKKFNIRVLQIASIGFGFTESKSEVVQGDAGVFVENDYSYSDFMGEILEHNFQSYAFYDETMKVHEKPTLFGSLMIGEYQIKRRVKQLTHFGFTFGGFDQTFDKDNDFIYRCRWEGLGDFDDTLIHSFTTPKQVNKYLMNLRN